MPRSLGFTCTLLCILGDTVTHICRWLVTRMYRGETAAQFELPQLTEYTG